MAPRGHGPGVGELGPRQWACRQLRQEQREDHPAEPGADHPGAPQAAEPGRPGAAAAGNPVAGRGGSAGVEMRAPVRRARHAGAAGRPSSTSAASSAVTWRRCNSSSVCGRRSAWKARSGRRRSDGCSHRRWRITRRMTETAPQRILLSVLTAARHSFRAGQDGRRRRVSQHDERGHCGGETKPVVRADALFAGLTARNVCRNAWREPGLCKGRGARASSRTSPRGSSRTSSSSPAEAPPSPRSWRQASSGRT
jgi:hypothetical protein